MIQQKRIVFQNINRLQPKLTNKWKPTLLHAEHLQANLIGLCETSVTWYKNSTRKQYNTMLRKKFKKTCIVVSKLPSLKDKLHLPGGTIKMAILDNQLMGRWTRSTYQLGNRRN
jgi:hypothetical protein